MLGLSHLSQPLLLAWLLLPVPSIGVSSTPRGPDEMWAALGTSDPRKAEQVTAYLVARPGLALPLLRQRLKPVNRVDRDQLRRLIADLDDDRFTIRERASQGLEGLGDPVEGVLRQTLAGQPSAEVRRRIGLLLERLRTLRLHPPPERVRRSRAIDVLEQVASSEAREILTRLAGGAPDAELTLQAKSALDRLRTFACPSP
jgi:hypothetical protein